MEWRGSGHHFGGLRATPTGFRLRLDECSATAQLGDRHLYLLSDDGLTTSITMTRDDIPSPLTAITDVDGLALRGLTSPAQTGILNEVAAQFRIRLSAETAQSTSAGVLDQFVPQAAELNILPEELADPIGDQAHSPVTGLTHRYPDRVILHTTQTCEVYCRFCFRRETVGDAGMLSEAEIDGIVAYLAANPQIWEVILTGGDPLVLSPRRLGALLAKLSSVPSLQVIRFHSRIPVVAPEKITPALLATLDIRPAVWLVVHTNHPDEITPNVSEALRRLSRAGIPLLSQTVLLNGINADPDTLEALFRKLIAHRVKPYYLHHPDLAKGTGHFRLSIARGQEIMAALRGRISGTGLPLYVLDIPGGFGKVPIGPGYLTDQGDGQWLVTDPQGIQHLYQDVG